MPRYTDDPNSALNLIDDPAFTDMFSHHESMLQDGRFGTAGSGHPLATFMHDGRQPPMTEMEEAIRYYDDNYVLIAQHFVAPTGKVYLGDKDRGVCRFCGRSKPEVTFENDAHAIPESLGNRTLLSHYECDDCNKRFGLGIENDFGNWCMPMRTMARIRGKKGYPTIRLDHAGIWRIEATSGSNLNILGDPPAFIVDEANKELHLRLPRGDYVPVAVLKALVKMGLTILPDEEMPNFKEALAWIREKDHSQGVIPTHPVAKTFVPGPLPNNFIVLMVWRRKHDGLQVPYASFVLTYANEMIQVFLPTTARNGHLARKRLRTYRFPNLAEIKGEQFGPTETHTIDLSGTAVVKGDLVEATMRFEAVIPRPQGD